TAATGSGRLPFSAASLERGASVTCPGCPATGLTSVTVCGRPRFSTEILAAAAGSTGAPWLRGITPSLAWNVGGAGGGAARTTTGRETMLAGGRGTDRDSVVTAPRSAPAVGTAGTGPRSTGAATTWFTTARSCTHARVTGVPATNADRLITVM